LYVGWANENGIINGIEENKFDPYANVTREQMAVIMSKLATFLKKTAAADISLTYPDSASISSWAIEAAKYCQETKVIEGRTDGIFAPQESATRAEASAILQRVIANMLK
jgi:S-layer homology domain